MQFEPGSTHVAHVSVSNLARRPYTYRLTFMLRSDNPYVVPVVLGSELVTLDALQSDVIDVPVTFWGFEVPTYFQISAYEETTETPLGVILSEPVDMAVVSPPDATVTLYWD